MRRVAPLLVLLGLAAVAAVALARVDDSPPARGTVTIANTGSDAAALVLRGGEVTDTPGRTGGVLSDQLSLSVVDVTAPAAPRAVYAGPLATMPAQPLGDLRPGEARTFEFTATLPEGGGPGPQNAVQGAARNPASPEPPAPARVAPT